MYLENSQQKSGSQDSVHYHLCEDVVTYSTFKQWPLDSNVSYDASLDEPPPQIVGFHVQSFPVANLDQWWEDGMFHVVIWHFLIFEGTPLVLNIRSTIELLYDLSVALLGEAWNLSLYTKEFQLCKHDKLSSSSVFFTEQKTRQIFRRHEFFRPTGQPSGWWWKGGQTWLHWWFERYKKLVKL